MSDLEIIEPSKHIGHKIGSVRRLIGLSQSALGERLGVTKQAVSKLEQSEKIDEKRIKEVANALGVTEEGLKKFKEESVIYNTLNFYENCGVNSESVIANVENLNQTPIDKLTKLFEELLKIEREKFEKVAGNNGNSKK